ncbi:MAG TPA: ferredoxin [Syntrophomonadaceae bacterium]|nr:ferredoxin [Syntrophomonadaceae bacterium]
MKASVDRDICIGCGLCEITCPEVFELDDEMISTVIVDEIPEDLEECAEEAEEECPVTAITID